MDLYILDVNFTPVELVENYETLVWTERFFEPGEFELTTVSTPENSSQLRIGTYLGVNTSPRIMVIETVEDLVGAEGIRQIKATGRSIELIFEKRVARHHMLMLDEDEVWKFTQKLPGQIMRTLVYDICMTGVLSPDDIIPQMVKREGNSTGLFYDKSHLMPEPHIPIDMEIGVKSLSKALAQVNNKYPLGYRLYRDITAKTNNLYFDVYTGTNRTLMQNEVTPIIFSLPWGSLKSTSDLDTIADYFNTAYVFSKYGHTTVSRGNPTGLLRNVMDVVVSGDQVDKMVGSSLTQYLKQKGEEALEEHKREALFEGEIAEDYPYIYNKDYFLGDHVDLIGENNVGAVMSIIENITTIDQEGVRSFPTLQMEEHIDPDTWSGLRGGEVWSTMPGFWSDY